MKIGSHFGNWGRIEPFRDDIVTIGDYVILGFNSLIVTHCPISFYNGKSVNIVIGNNVYIGAYCVVLPGVAIGDNVVIGAGSIVSRDIPSNVIAAGSPCSPIREITEKESNRLKTLTIQNKVANGDEPEALNENR